MNRRKTDRGETGFSLTELLVVLALMGLLAAIGLPTMKTFYYGWRVKGTAQRISMMFQKARLRAVDTRAQVTITFNAMTADRTILSYVEGWQGANSVTGVYKTELLTIQKPSDLVQIGWDVGDNMVAPLVITFNSDGTVTHSPTAANANNRPPRIDVYLRRSPRAVAPAYVRVNTRGSVYTGKLDLAIATFSPVTNNNAYYQVMGDPAHPEELRQGIKVVTTAE